MIDLDKLERLAKAYVSLIQKSSEIYPRLDSELNNRIHFATCKFEDAATPETILSLIARVRKLEAALKPFAELAPFYHADNDALKAWNIDYQPTVGDLRLARNRLDNDNENN